MNTTKRFVLLVALLVGWKVSTAVVRADNECTQACGQAYDMCLADANDERQQCYTEAEWEYQSCYMSAGSAASSCGENCYADCFGGYCTPQDLQQCYNECGSQYHNETQSCAQSYYSAAGGCDFAQSAANERCATEYNACFNNCPQPTPEP